jgi:filamentous hemagglutinin
VLVGVEMDPRLGTPAGGWDYEPHVVHGARSEAAAYSHYIGYQAELRLANEVVATNQVVLKYGDPIGRHGADIVSVDPNSGAVTLWDSKYRARGGTLEQSPTFSGLDTRRAAISEAIQLVRKASDLLPDGVRQQAEAALRAGNFTTNTAGTGGLRNSVQVRYCNGVPC